MDIYKTLGPFSSPCFCDPNILRSCFFTIVIDWFEHNEQMDFDAGFPVDKAQMESNFLFSDIVSISNSYDIARRSW